MTTLRSSSVDEDIAPRPAPATIGRPVDDDRRPGATIFWLTGVGAFLVSLDVSIANSLLPAIGADLRISDRAALSWIITAYAIVFAAALVPAGRIADRAGRRRAFMGGLLVFAVGSLLCGAAPDLGLLIAGRVLQGVGAAAASPASVGLLLAATGPRHRSLYAARWTGVAAFGMCLGPLVGGAVTDAGSWRWAFLLNVPLVVVVCVAGPRVLPETARQPGRSLPDPIGAVVLVVAASALVLGISEASTWGTYSVRTIASVGLGAALAVIFARRCARVQDPLLDLGLLRQRRFALATITTVLYACGFFGMLLSFVLFLVGTWHLSLVGTGLAILPMGGVVMLMTTGVGRLAGRVGFRLPLVAGSTLMAVGLVLSAAFYTGSHLMWSWLPIAVLTGVGIGLCYPLLAAAAVAGLPFRDLAAATAVNQCARQIGAAFGIAVAVAVLGPANPTPVERFHAAWLVGAGFCALAALASCSMPGRVTA